MCTRHKIKSQNSTNCVAPFHMNSFVRVCRALRERTSYVFCVFRSAQTWLVEWRQFATTSLFTYRVIYLHLNINIKFISFPYSSPPTPQHTITIVNQRSTLLRPGVLRCASSSSGGGGGTQIDSHVAFCKSSLNHLQLPYIRTTHKVDFFILFLALWMDILTLICACGALARTMSICLDAMTGGMARIYILGRNAPINEPWPDVIGFSIIFLVSVMFMLGLEVRLRVHWRLDGDNPSFSFP